VLKVIIYFLSDENYISTKKIYDFNFSILLFHEDFKDQTK